MTISHEHWIVACAAWNNVTPEQMRAMCDKNDQRMPSGSRNAWNRVFKAVSDTVKEPLVAGYAIVPRVMNGAMILAVKDLLPGVSSVDIRGAHQLAIQAWERGEG